MDPDGSLVNPMITPELHDQWITDCQNAPGAALALSRLLDRYNEPHRRYHDVRHVTAVVQRVTSLVQGMFLTETEISDLRLAAWFHDVIYEPSAHDNEAQSTKHASAELGSLGIPSRRTKRIGALINMTAGHVPSDTGAAVLLDADLWTLGGSEHDYFVYGGLIREEYSAVSDAQWLIGRARFINTFLGRPRIFHTDTGFAQQESPARHNLALELERLKT
jgi:predicted metal-dependent HD superfamily phosphohydrolase